MIHRTIILITLLFLNSCSSQKSKKADSQSVQDENELEIICFHKTLKGEKEIYKISEDILYSFGKEEKIKSKQYNNVRNIPEQILEKNQKLGCGTCVDGMDYKFVFKNRNAEVIWEIQAGYDIPEQYEQYFNLLISISDTQVGSNRD
ncbi:hypothetical protein [uncultured Aquimarina sp.]|uniref:hypothetical protein n=1 Tax=uncultured Aquimarina sp. TaxID=575652 RepID=UPI00262343C3|nr:hypothetical protein [uncultured Aquimarina sp.]